MTDDLAALLDHLKTGPVDVLGWSDGGIEALFLGIRHPAKVKKIVAMAANLNPSDKAVRPDILDRISQSMAAVPAADRDTPRGQRELKVIGMMLEEPNIEAKALEAITAPPWYWRAITIRSSTSTPSRSPARDPWQTRPKHASFLRPPRVRLCAFVRCVRSHAAGCSRGHSPFRGITAFAPVSHASASGIRLALPLALAAIDLANLLREHLRLIECGVGRRLENGALAAAHATGGRTVRAESATEREKQLPGASVSDRRDRFIRHPQVMAQATPCIRRKT